MNRKRGKIQLSNAIWLLGRAPLYVFQKKSKNYISDAGRISLLLNLASLASFGVFLVLYSYGQWLLFSRYEDAESLPLGWEILVYIGLILVTQGIRSFWIIRLSLFEKPGSNHKYLDRFVESMWPFFAGCWAILSKAFLVAVLLVSFVSKKIVSNDLQNSEVAILYDAESAPEWIFRLGFFPIARQANRMWGEGSASIAPLSVSTLNKTLKSNQFVYVASHGTEGRILANSEWITPDMIDRNTVSPRLKLVYISACFSGVLAEEWEATLLPGEVVTFNRVSLMSEHILFLLVNAPEIVASWTIIPGFDSEDL